MGKDVVALRASCPTLHVKRGEGGPERLADVPRLSGRERPWPTLDRSAHTGSAVSGNQEQHLPFFLKVNERKLLHGAPADPCVCTWGARALLPRTAGGEPAGSVENACSSQLLVADPPSTLCM